MKAYRARARVLLRRLVKCCGLVGLARLGEEAGRDPATLDLTTVCFLTPPGFAPQRPIPGRPLGGPGPSAERLVEELGLLGQEGVSLCSLWMPLSGEGRSGALEWVVGEILPRL